MVLNINLWAILPLYPEVGAFKRKTILKTEFPVFTMGKSICTMGFSLRKR